MVARDPVTIAPSFARLARFFGVGFAVLSVVLVAIGLPLVLVCAYSIFCTFVFSFVGSRSKCTFSVSGVSGGGSRLQWDEIGSVIHLPGSYIVLKRNAFIPCVVLPSASSLRVPSDLHQAVQLFVPAGNPLRDAIAA